MTPVQVVERCHSITGFFTVVRSRENCTAHRKRRGRRNGLVASSGMETLLFSERSFRFLGTPQQSIVQVVHSRDSNER